MVTKMLPFLAHLPINYGKGDRMKRGSWLEARATEKLCCSCVSPLYLHRYVTKRNSCVTKSFTSVPGVKEFISKFNLGSRYASYCLYELVR